MRIVAKLNDLSEGKLPNSFTRTLSRVVLGLGLRMVQPQALNPATGGDRGIVLLQV